MRTLNVRRLKESGLLNRKVVVIRLCFCASADDLIECVDALIEAIICFLQLSQESLILKSKQLISVILYRKVKNFSTDNHD
jgi:hypothetical protein